MRAAHHRRGGTPSHPTGETPAMAKFQLHETRPDESIIEGRLHVFHGGRWLPVPSGGADDTPPEDASKKSEPAPSEPATTGHPPATVPPAEHNPDDGTPMPAPVHPVPEVPDAAAIHDRTTRAELRATPRRARRLPRRRTRAARRRRRPCQALADMDRIAERKSPVGVKPRRSRIADLASLDDQTAPARAPGARSRPRGC
jgi:hypothetical protein